MKKLKILAGLMMAAMLFASCSKEQQDANPVQKDLNFKTTPELLAAQYPLYAGQDIYVGYVEIKLEESTGELTVCYKITESGWVLEEIHFVIGAELPDNIFNSQGNPVPGSFPYINDDLGVTEYCFLIPAVEGVADCGDSFVALAHAAVKYNDDEDIQTAWGYTEVLETSTRWAYQIVDQILCTDDMECWAEETAWAAGTRYVPKGNWATYTAYVSDASVILYAGQTFEAGMVSFSAVSDNMVTVTVSLNTDWRFQDVPENVYIQDYGSAPAGNPSPGLFAWKDYATGNEFSVDVPANNFYGIHVNVEQRVDCPPPPAE